MQKLGNRKNQYRNKSKQLMTSVQKNNFHFLLYAFTFSLLLHVLVFNTFSFTISPLKSENRPNFIFLGSILKKHNITDLSFSSGSHNRANQSSDYSQKILDLRETPARGKPVQKPYTPNLIPNNKRTTKSLFDVSLDSKKKKEKKKEESVEVQIEPYKPLRLYVQ